MATSCVSGRTSRKISAAESTGDGVELGAVVAGDAVEARVAGVEVGLEDLHPPARDDRPADPPDQLLALAANMTPLITSIQPGCEP